MIRANHSPPSAVSKKNVDVCDVLVANTITDDSTTTKTTKTSPPSEDQIVVSNIDTKLQLSGEEDPWVNINIFFFIITYFLHLKS